jgi:hypothetical protein
MFDCRYLTLRPVSPVKSWRIDKHHGFFLINILRNGWTYKGDGPLLYSLPADCNEFTNRGMLSNLLFTRHVEVGRVFCAAPCGQPV